MAKNALLYSNKVLGLNYDKISEEKNNRQKNSTKLLRLVYVTKVQRRPTFAKYMLDVEISTNLYLVAKELDPCELSKDVRKRRLKDRISPSS